MINRCMSNVIQFPKKYVPSPRGYRINLYTEEEISMVLLCLNLSESQDSTKKWLRKDLRSVDPMFVMNRMWDALDSTLLSKYAKETIKRIVNSIEVIPLSALEG